MRRINYFSYFLILLATISFVSCSDDDDNDKLKSGITNQSWTEGKAVEISEGNALSVSFNAASKWVASSNSNWCKVLTKSGSKGQNNLKLSVETSTNIDRTATITINTDGYSPTSFEVKQKADGTSPATEDMEVNAKVDQYLSEMYLWNDEYKTLDLDYSKNYEEFFYGALGSMRTNTLDKRPTADGRYSLFSYIEKRKFISSTRSTKWVDKELAYSFGITGISAQAIGTQTDYTIYFFVQGVYPDSPAERAGIKRGSIIVQINGELLTENNINQYYIDLLMPNSALSLKITEETKEGGTRESTVTSEAMYCNPVLMSKVTTQEETPGHRIGYLVYSGFDASFDQELYDAFKEFKNQNITDLILDLRYNGGGHTMSANLIASCVAGAASERKIFSRLRYNKERMEKMKKEYDDELFSYPKYENLETSLSAGALNLKHIYCLVGNGTASASELVINSLRGIDVEVTLIGEKTTGKNVGMEYKDYDVRNNTYRVVPITFQSYNAKGFGDYEGGFAPTVEIDETNPTNETGIYYVYREYGENSEPLYAKAIELITGRNPFPTTRSAEHVMKGKALKMPAIHRPGYDGMLKRYETAE